jgi:hypothetical protein
MKPNFRRGTKFFLKNYETIVTIFLCEGILKEVSSNIGAP